MYYFNKEENDAELVLLKTDYRKRWREIFEEILTERILLTPKRALTKLLHPKIFGLPKGSQINPQLNY